MRLSRVPANVAAVAIFAAMAIIASSDATIYAQPSPQAPAAPTPSGAPPTLPVQPAPTAIDPMTGDFKPLELGGPIQPPLPSEPAAASVTLPPAKDVAKDSEKDKALSIGERDRIRQLCADKNPDCDPMALLGTLERTSLRRELAERHLTIDRSPWGKTVHHIYVGTESVFSRDDGFVQWFNVFHINTRAYVIAREVILEPGDPFDQSRLEETARRLRDPNTSSVAVAVPVVCNVPGMVDLLVFTRDVFSIRANSNYSYENGTFSYLTLSLSDNNLFGLHKIAAIGFTMDLGQIAVGPSYYDNNIMGTHMTLSANVQALFSRDALFDNSSLVSEGSASSIALAYPLWKLDSKWGAGITWTHFFGVQRLFTNGAIATYDDPNTVGDDMLQKTYYMRQFVLNSNVVRSVGHDVKYRFTLGHSLESTRPSLLSTFPGDAEQAASFTANVLPRSELDSVPYAQFDMFTPRYRSYRNISGFDLSEDVQLGPIVSATIGEGLKVLGGDANFTRILGSAGWTQPWGADGLLAASGNVVMRAQSNGLIDNSTSQQLRAVTPTWHGLRAVAQSTATTMWNETQNRYLTLGSDNGLRGFGIAQFTGQRLFLTQFDIRTVPMSLWTIKYGLVAFYDIGGSANTFSEMPLHQDAGIGIRLLIPQLTAALTRIDVAFPFDGEYRGQARITAGYGSSF